MRGEACPTYTRWSYIYRVRRPKTHCFGLRQYDKTCKYLYLRKTKPEKYTVFCMMIPWVGGTRNKFQTNKKNHLDVWGPPKASGDHLKHRGSLDPTRMVYARHILRALLINFPVTWDAEMRISGIHAPGVMAVRGNLRNH